MRLLAFFGGKAMMRYFSENGEKRNKKTLRGDFCGFLVHPKTLALWT